MMLIIARGMRLKPSILIFVGGNIDSLMGAVAVAVAGDGQALQKSDTGEGTAESPCSRCHGASRRSIEARSRCPGT